jgi:hypothetical protein
VTVALLWVSDTLGRYGLVIVAAAVGGVWWLRRWARTEKGRFAVDRVKLKIPVLGPIANALLWPMFSAGLALGCRALAEGQPLELGHLFAGFRERLGTLAGVGALTLAISFAIGIVVAVGMGVGFATMFSGAKPATPEAAMAALLAGLVMLALLLPLFMAVWFAPLLVVFHERGVLEAMKESFQGCLRNVVPFLVYGVAGFVLMVLASVPVLLGWLALGPVLIASIYTAYRDIYFKA